MVGGYALRYALDDPAVESVTAIGRKKLGISHPKFKEVLHGDFADCSSLADVLSSQDAGGNQNAEVDDCRLRPVLKPLGKRWPKNAFQCI